MKQRLFGRGGKPPATPPATPPTELGPVADQLAALAQQVERECVLRIGFPAATDIDYQPVLPLLRRLVNNLGDPFTDGILPGHTKALEREVIDFLSDLFAAPGDDRWGYVTNGGSEGNLAGLHLARTLHPNGLVYLSQDAHPSVLKAARLLSLPIITVRATQTGQIDTDDLRKVLAQHRHLPAIIAATAGTILTEAVDDVAAINNILRELAIGERYIHVDAALSGIPLILTDGQHRSWLRLDVVESVSMSGHKFMGTPIPCGVMLTRRSLQQHARHGGAYAASPDTTISGSRSGHAVIMLWYAISRYGISGLKQRAEQARTVADYAIDALRGIGWDAWRHPLACTVVIPTPPAEVVQRWALPVSGERTHLVCVPGVTTTVIDQFVTDLGAAVATSNGHRAASAASSSATTAP